MPDRAPALCAAPSSLRTPLGRTTRPPRLPRRGDPSSGRTPERMPRRDPGRAGSAASSRAGPRPSRSRLRVRSGAVRGRRGRSGAARETTRAGFAWVGEEQSPCRPLSALGDREKAREFGQMEQSRGQQPASPVNGRARARGERAETLQSQEAIAPRFEGAPRNGRHPRGKTAFQACRDRDHGSGQATPSAYARSRSPAEKGCKSGEKNRAP